MESSKLICPVCKRGRVIDVEKAVKYRAWNVATKPTAIPDFIGKCPNCGLNIGIKKVS